MTQSEGTRRRTEPPPGAPFRVGEVSRRTGVPVQTIRFYVTQGLLPAPVKTSRNMGWYSPLHVERLQLIQRLQRERFLPLRTIRTLVEGSERVAVDDDGVRLVQLRERLEGLSVAGMDPGAASRCMSEPEVSSRTDLALSPRERSMLAAIEHGASAASGAPSSPELARQWLCIRNAAGLSDRDAVEILKLISGIVDRAITHELEFMGSRYRAVTPAEVEKLLDVVIPSLNKLFALLHLRRFGYLFASDGRQRPGTPPAGKI